MSLTSLRSLIFALLFYVSTAIFVVGGSFRAGEELHGVGDDLYGLAPGVVVCVGR